MKSIEQLEQEADWAEQLLAQCDSEIVALEGLIAYLERGGGSEIYDTAPPPIFEDSDYKIEQRKEYSPEIFEKSGQEHLRDLQNSLTQQQQKLPSLVRNYQQAIAAYEKALKSFE